MIDDFDSSLAADEMLAQDILAGPPDDPRCWVATALLDVIDRIRRHRSWGWDTSVEVLEWQRFAGALSFVDMLSQEDIDQLNYKVLRLGQSRSKTEIANLLMRDFSDKINNLIRTQNKNQ